MTVNHARLKTEIWTCPLCTKWFNSFHVTHPDRIGSHVIVNHGHLLVQTEVANTSGFVIGYQYTCRCGCGIKTATIEPETAETSVMFSEAQTVSLGLHIIECPLWKDIQTLASFGIEYTQLLARGKWAVENVWEADRCGFFPPGRHQSPGRRLGPTA